MDRCEPSADSSSSKSFVPWAQKLNKPWGSTPGGPSEANFRDGRQHNSSQCADIIDGCDQHVCYFSRLLIILTQSLTLAPTLLEEVNHHVKTLFWQSTFASLFKPTVSILILDTTVTFDQNIGMIKTAIYELKFPVLEKKRPVDLYSLCIR